MKAGASAALLAVLRARRPDLSWEIIEVDPEEQAARERSGVDRPTVLEYLREHRSEHHSEHQDERPVDTSEKVRENRLRRAASRRGLKLVKSRTRDHKALDYGRWWIADLETGLVIHGSDERLTIDDIEEWMDRD